MSEFIQFTDEEKEQASLVDLESFLRSKGEKLLRSGHDMRLANDHSITICGNKWYDHAISIGGNAISFIEYYYNTDFQSAVTMLLGDTIYQPATVKETTPTPPSPFALPEANPAMNRVLGYLENVRKIDDEIISHFVRKHLIYEDKKHHNIVFVGTDENGAPRHAHKRSTNSHGKSFRITVEGSNIDYAFHHIGSDDKLYAFEAPIDLLSYLTMHPTDWQQHSYVACCGTTPRPVLTIIKQHPEIKTVYICFDNDIAGDKAANRLQEVLSEENMLSERLLPEYKDWNDDLVINSVQDLERSPQCMSMF